MTPFEIRLGNRCIPNRQACRDSPQILFIPGNSSNLVFSHHQLKLYIVVSTVVVVVDKILTGRTKGKRQSHFYHSIISSPISPSSSFFLAIGQLNKGGIQS